MQLTNGSLQLASAQKEDTAEYECVARNLMGSVLVRVALTVRGECVFVCLHMCVCVCVLKGWTGFRHGSAIVLDPAPRAWRPTGD